MNFGDLKNELKARGFDYLSEARAARWVNRGYHRLCEEYQWPFLETSTSGSSPLSVADLRAVLQVINTSNPRILTGEDERSIRRKDPALTGSGSPEAWYFQGGSTIKTYPENSDTIYVSYLKSPADLVSDTDIPVVPSRYHNLIVDAAVILALRDDDEWEQAAALKAQYDEEVARMASSLLNRNYANPGFIQSAGLWWERDA